MSEIKVPGIVVFRSCVFCSDIDNITSIIELFLCSLPESYTFMHLSLWTEIRTVYASQVDTARRLRLVSLCQMLQEAAGSHANALGLGFDQMHSLGQVWVLNRWKAEINEAASWRDTLRIETWIREMSGPFSWRDFEVLHESGSKIASASALWVALDIHTRRPVRQISSPAPVPLIPQKTAACGTALKIAAREFPEPPLLFTVNYSDLDMVGHVNNTSYLRWMQDALYAQTKHRELLSVEMQFLAEAHSGTVEVYTAYSPTGAYGVVRQGAEDLCRAAFTFRPDLS
ncbi:MAG: hypothetical protein EAZ89_16670 [Bacteroidetes bacterium]|nr:MAG: hypothetical protein EAZ89_16670 [Bacteroidota bacterium]